MAALACPAGSPLWSHVVTTSYHERGLDFMGPLRTAALSPQSPSRPGISVVRCLTGHCFCSLALHLDVLGLVWFSLSSLHLSPASELPI